MHAIGKFSITWSVIKGGIGELNFFGGGGGGGYPTEGEN